MKPLRFSARAAAPIFVLVLCAGLSAPAQTTMPPAQSPAPAGVQPAAPAAPSPTNAATAQASQPEAKKPALPDEFRGIKLGMAIEEVQKVLQQDSLFEYRGPEDVSLLPQRNQSLVEASGASFVKRAFFQFYEGKLWVIVVFLNPDKMDHYSIYSTLAAKYGEPTLLNPKEARWEDKNVRMALERPLTLRYMDMAVFARLSEGSDAQAGAVELERRDFLGGL
jgi:hypothetical protein